MFEITNQHRKFSDRGHKSESVTIWNSHRCHILSQMLTSLVWLVQVFNNLCFVFCLNPDWNGSNHPPFMGIHHLWAFTIYGHSPFMGIHHSRAFTIYGHSPFMGIHHLWASFVRIHPMFDIPRRAPYNSQCFEKCVSLFIL